MRAIIKRYMRTKIFSKKYTINRITEYYNISRSEAEEIFKKTYQKIRYKASDVGNLKGFSATRETFFSIFGKKGGMYATTYINPNMPDGYRYEIHTKDFGKDGFKYAVGDRLSALIDKYPEVEKIYKKFLITGDIKELNREIEDFKRSPDYIKEGSP